MTCQHGGRAASVQRLRRAHSRVINFVKGAVDSKDLSLGISPETLQRHKILCVIGKTLVKECFVMLAEIAQK